MIALDKIKKFFKKYPLATQVLVRVFSIYFIIATLVTSLHMYWQYHDTKSVVTKEMKDTFSMASEGLAKALWEYNDGQITKTLKGLELLPFISTVTLLDSEGNTYTSGSKDSIDPDSPQEKNLQSIIKYAAPLVIGSSADIKNIDQVVGYLTLYGNDKDLFERLELGFWLLIINALIKTLAIWMVFIGVGYVMISRPLSALTKATEMLDLTSSEPLPIDIKVPRENELTVLASSFNQMSNRLFTIKNQLEHKGNYDGLTGLPNRQLFLDRLSQAIKLAHRTGHIVAVLFIDLDRFKEINDSLGHQIGDEVLKEVGLRLSKRIREIDTLSRLGGDEFTIILDSLQDKNSVVGIIEQMNEIMNKPIYVNKQPLYTTLSIGVAFYPEDADTPDRLLKNADAAMYKAKDEGRNTYQFYTKEMTSKALEHILMESNLRKALEHHEFVVYYQAQVSASDNHIFGMEALVRWNHPELGMIPPNEFIPLAEKTGLIIPLGEEVFDIASKQIAKWMSDSSLHCRVAINLSVKQLQQQNIVSKLTEILAKNKCNPTWVELEVTEGYVMKSPELAIQTLQDFSNMGIEISIDDFGTGYSSLSYLKRLPINTLKIDQSFVRDLSVDEDDKAIVRSIISLSKAMNLEVIAEGVETVEQKEFLLKNGCNKMQGYLFSKPVPALDMGELLRTKFK